MRTRRIEREEYLQLRHFLPKQDRIMADIMVETGMRISDVLNLPADLNTTVIHVHEQKTGKERTVHIKQKTLDEVRKHAKHCRTAALFDIDESTVYRHLKTASKRLGMENISAHSFRKLYAKEYYDRYGLRATQLELCHDNPVTTLIYITEWKD